MYSVKAIVWKCQPMPYMIINLLSDVTLVALASVVVDFVVVEFAMRKDNHNAVDALHAQLSH
jgi:hypothetical protein